MVQLPVLTAINSQITNSTDQFLPVKTARVFSRWNINRSEKQLQEYLQRAIAEFDTQKNNPMSNAEVSVFDSDISNSPADIGISIIDIDTASIVEANSAICAMYGYSHSEFIGLHEDTIIHPISKQIFTEFIQPLSLDSAFSALVANIHSDSSIFYSEVFGTGILIDNRLNLIIFARKCENESESNKLILDWLKDLSTEQSTLTGIIQTLSSNLELDPDHVLEQIKQIIPFSLGVFFGMEREFNVFIGHKWTDTNSFFDAYTKPCNNNEPVCREPAFMYWRFFCI